MKLIHIAIDGPVASGKGSVARGLSKALGIPCLDTGALYRGIAVHVRDNSPSYNEGVAPHSGDGVGADFLKDIKMTAKIVDGVTRVSLGGVDVTTRLRDNEISKISGGGLASIPQVRAFCTKISQDIARSTSLIAEGRDICNVVLPDAKHKFFLTAKPKVRAMRRYKELTAKGQDIAFKQVFKETKARDKMDYKRNLKNIKNVVFIDSTNMTIDETVKHMLNIIDGKEK